MKIKYLLLSVYLLPFIIVSFYNHPAIDDYWSAHTIMDNGRLGAVKIFYDTVSARFFSNFLMGLLNTLPNGSIWIFKIWPIAVIFFLLASSLFFYTSVFKYIIRTKTIILASVLFVVLHIANIRVLFDGLYWMSSTICYQVAICLFFIGIGAIIRHQKSPSILYGCLAVGCSLLLPGSAEVLAPIYIITLFFMLYLFVKQKSNYTLIIICLITGLASILFIAVSPGNNARIENNSIIYNRDIFMALFYAARAVGYYFFYWLTTPINLAALILLLPALNKIVKNEKYKFPTLNIQPIILFFILFFICVIIYFPSTYFESPVLAPRITTLVFFISTHLFVLFTAITLQNNERFSRIVVQYSGFKNFSKYAWVLFFITAYTSINFSWVTTDIVSGNADSFSREAHQRYETIKNCNEDTCFVSRYVNWPNFIQSGFKEDIDFKHMNKYFGKTIIYKDATPGR